jgi:molecular chaperone GrpE
MEGFKLIHAKLMAILKEEGLQRVAAEGETFDPNIHEALHVQEVAEEADDGKVLAEWEKGYFFKETLLRPSKVQVGKLKSE